MAWADFFLLGCYFFLLLILTPFLGAYMAQVFSGQRIFLSWILNPIERLIYRICFVDASEEMRWEKYTISLVWFSLFGLLVLFCLQVFQAHLPLNPQKFPSVSTLLAWNTAISFVTNTNWQAYAGENTMSYQTAVLGLSVQNFLSAACGFAVLLAFIRALIQKGSGHVGNFWVDITRCVLYVLLPLSLILSLLLVSQGVLQNFSSNIEARTLEGKTQILPMGPVASQVAIKQLGTNGGGFFGVNSTHPFENPTPVSNFLQMLALLIIPSAQVYMFGVMTKEHKHARLIYGVMMCLFLALLIFGLWAEHSKNKGLNLSKFLEGKEMRFSITASVLWANATTTTSNGSVNAMLDSFSPLAGGACMLAIFLGEVIFGGVGSGLYGMLLFVLLAVFLAGLMVGRTPHYFGKKIEAFEMKMVVIGLLFPGAVILLGAGFCCFFPAFSKLTNNGPHGLSEILYAWASAANNNGSAFAGLDANTPFYNSLLGLAMLLGRFGVIFPIMALAGSLAQKEISPTQNASIAVDNIVFAVLLILVVIAIGALTFFPVFSLGPLVEHLLMQAGRVF